MHVARCVGADGPFCAVLEAKPAAQEGRGSQADGPWWAGKWWEGGIRAEGSIPP